MRLPPTFLDRLLGRDPLAGMLADLGRVLNAREPAAGSPDLTRLDPIDPSDPDDLARLARRVAAVIRRHDPRLQRVGVRAVEGGDEVRLHVTLYLPAPAGPVRVDAVRSDRRWQLTPTGGSK